MLCLCWCKWNRWVFCKWKEPNRQTLGHTPLSFQSWKMTHLPFGVSKYFGEASPYWSVRVPQGLPDNWQQSMQKLCALDHTESLWGQCKEWRGQNLRCSIGALWYSSWFSPSPPLKGIPIFGADACLPERRRGSLYEWKKSSSASQDCAHWVLPCSRVRILATKNFWTPLALLLLSKVVSFRWYPPVASKK